MADKISASSPDIVFLAGEYAFCWGAKSIALPVDFDDSRNRVALVNSVGNPKLVIYQEEKIASLEPSGRPIGDASLRPYVDSCKAVLATVGRNFSDLTSATSITVFPATSDYPSSRHQTALAVSSALFAFFGYKPTAAELLKCACAAGIEQGEFSEPLIRSALLGKPSLVKKEFLLDGSVGLKCDWLSFSLPKGTSLLYSSPERSAAASYDASLAGIAKFFKATTSSGRVKQPIDMTRAERDKIISNFDGITDKMLREMSGGNSAMRLGSLLDLANELLIACGAGQGFPQESTKAAKDAGALGAKPSGYWGGVIALCKDSETKEVAQALALCGGNVHLAMQSGVPASVDD